MQSHYEINVSLNGCHFFATAPRSCVRRDQAAAVARELIKRFPESEGYAVTILHLECVGRWVDRAATINHLL